MRPRRELQSTSNDPGPVDHDHFPDVAARRAIDDGAQAEAWLEIPLERGWSPRTFALDIAAVAPTGTWLTVRANDKDIYNAMIKTAPVSLSLRLPPKLRKRLRLELVSDTFIPSDVDERALGVRIKSMTLR